jgi:hypothetical protein
MTKKETAGSNDSATAAADAVIEDAAREKPRRGRPPGTGKKKPAEKEAPAEIVVTEGDIELAATIGGVVFDIIGPFAKMAPLEDSQRRRVGEALAPLVQKYMPLLANWQYEAAALITISAIIIEARRNYVPPKPPAPPEEVATDAAPGRN